MLKSMIAAATCLVLIASPLAAKESVELKIEGEYQAAFKSQNDYVSLLDRSASNNRSKQYFVQTAELEFQVGYGKKEERGIEYYSWTGIAGFDFSPGDPDTAADANDSDADTSGLPVNFDKTYIKYKPNLALSVTLGTQSFYETDIGAAHGYNSDIQGDFDFLRSATSVSGSGFSADYTIFSAGSHKLGIAMLDSVSGVGAFYTSQAIVDNKVLTYHGTLGNLEIIFGYQSVAHGGTEDTDDQPGLEGHYKNENTHTEMNFAARFRIGGFMPYIGYQTVDGDKDSVTWTSDVIDAMFSTDGAWDLAKDAFGLKDETQKGSGNGIMVGLVAEIGPGRLAIDYSNWNNPDLGEEGCIWNLVDLKSVTMVEYQMPVNESVTVNLFYYSLATDDKMTKLYKYLDEEATTNADPALQALAGGARDGIEGYILTDTTAMGIGLNMEF